MKSCLVSVGVTALLLSLCSGCGGGGGGSDDESGAGSLVRRDAARMLAIPGSGSRQNPAWSPGGDRILFTRFVGGYNVGPARLETYRLADGQTRTLVADAFENVNLPGSAWFGGTDEILFSSSRDPHDEIYVIGSAAATGSETRITNRVGLMAFEPSWSADGQFIVFESHVVDTEDNGVLFKYKRDGTLPFQALTAAGADARQPNWSPDGSWIVYQMFEAGQWDIWLMASDGTNPHKLTSGPGDKTDASFSPNSKWIVYSADGPTVVVANLFAVPVAGGAPVRLTDSDAYDGAPSWSPDGKQILFESFPGDPDGSAGTRIFVLDDIPAPAGS